jgi:hypothetical protein
MYKVLTKLIKVVDGGSSYDSFNEENENTGSLRRWKVHNQLNNYQFSRNILHDKLVFN